VAARGEVRTVFDLANIQVEGSNSVLGVDVSTHFSLYVEVLR
jgi:hypothetical protein